MGWHPGIECNVLHLRTLQKVGPCAHHAAAKNDVDCPLHVPDVVPEHCSALLTSCLPAVILLQVDVNTEVGVIHDYGLQELRLYTDFGRTSRPLFIVKDQRLLLKKSHIHKVCVLGIVVIHSGCGEFQSRVHVSTYCNYSGSAACSL